MSATQIDVLILEDNERAFQSLREYILARFGSQVSVSPTRINDTERDLDNWNYLIERIQGNAFEEVLNRFSAVNLLIIDVNLEKHTDGLGENFRDFVRSKGYVNTEILFISDNIDHGKIKLGKFDHFLSKAIEGGHFRNAVIQFMAEKFSLSIQRNKPVATLPASGGSGGRKLSLWSKITSLGFLYGLHSVRKFLEEGVVRLIDKFVLLMFYCVLLVTVISAGLNIVSEFSPVKLYDLGVPHLPVDPSILTKAERIFLYLLPIFIVFGFYNYYKTNARVYLLEGNSKNIDEGESTRGMNLTKVLFVSSIISYILIKVIEEIFEDPIVGTGNFSSKVLKLVSSGILLLVLMCYFIFLDKHNQKNRH
ncbi:MAG TPA: hypothetical protein VGO47_10600 [Chlamydiales bacterium]|nr:hypothetical protein [Chlamydiales bacterium]